MEMQRQADCHKMRVQVSVYHARKYDLDNLWGSQKPVLDALKNIGLIRDDSEEWLQLDAPTQVIGKERKTVVTLEAL